MTFLRNTVIAAATVASLVAAVSTAHADQRRQFTDPGQVSYAGQQAPTAEQAARRAGAFSDVYRRNAEGVRFSKNDPAFVRSQYNRYHGRFAKGMGGGRAALRDDPSRI